MNAYVWEKYVLVKMIKEMGHLTRIQPWVEDLVCNSNMLRRRIRKGASSLSSHLCNKIMMEGCKKAKKGQNCIGQKIQYIHLINIGLLKCFFIMKWILQPEYFILKADSFHKLISGKFWELISWMNGFQSCHLTQSYNQRKSPKLFLV